MLEKRLLKELLKYVDTHLIKEEFILYEKSLEALPSHETEKEELEDYIHHNRRESFAETLFSFIDKKGLEDVNVYKKAGIDRKHFSKIRSSPTYQISKQTGIALALALQLNKKETEELLHAAGFSLSEHDTFDLIIQFFLEKEIYDIDQVNQALEYFSLKALIRN